MIDLPPNALIERAVEPEMLSKCIDFASKRFDVNKIVIRAIVNVEGGKIGTISRNSNGSYDLGVMQINTIHLKDIRKKYPRVGWRELAFNPCINIAVGTSILSERISESPNYWLGVGSYHSKTPKYRNRYLGKVKKAVATLIAGR
ncbi:lytic transglycosylase domain-containing protein [Aeromonas sp. MrichA-1]|jgi:soluble lytic murein transglycosylase-like protein|uniref:lytic transglycosylase domain-containing protein n=1 Tax=Aeromonas TaxID=642 RepID=UPI001B342F20|nr:lytic transglycosylase domain-containing protein [Aeromonas sp. MrichA-1]MBP4081536.1 lytic transglycosylase domain-containing protein [Aeromonas sp. MrichA-1]